MLRLSNALRAIPTAFANRPAPTPANDNAPGAVRGGALGGWPSAWMI